MKPLPAIVINFVLRDYGALWMAIGTPQWAIVWRETGFYDENGVSRPALNIWRDALDKEHTAATRS